ncbi:MAG: hypothetical protein LAO56_15705 [Acidobacteriia bacterium]|nr:hypothetical protein [Terriglobia bacterium]
MSWTKCRFLEEWRVALRKTARLTGFLALVTLLVLAGGPVCTSEAQTAPSRLRVRMEHSTLKVGEATRIFVEFLGSSYEPVANNQERVVNLKVVPLGASGAGELQYTEIKVGPGQTGELGFVAKAAGKVEVQAESQGLSPGRTVLVIVPERGASFRFLPLVYAQDSLQLEILPKDVGPIPANGITPIPFKITLNRSVRNGETLTIRVQNNCACPMRYRGQTTTVPLDIVLGEGMASTDEIAITRKRPGPATISARVLQSSAQDSLAVAFMSPKPNKFLFDNVSALIPAGQQVIPLTIRLADQDGVPVTQLAQRCTVRLRALSEPEIVSINPDQVKLQPNHPVGSASLSLSSSPSGGRVAIEAGDPSGDLEPANLTLAFESQLNSVVVSGPAQIARGKSRPLHVSFQDKNGRPAKADWDRGVNLVSSSGRVKPNRLLISRGSESGDVEYTASNATGDVTIAAMSSGLAQGALKIQVFTPMVNLVLWAGLLGIVGAFIRLTHTERMTRLMPKRDAGALDLGLIGNLPLGFVFGMILLLAAKIGFLAVPQAATGVSGTVWFAVFFGVLGGYGGQWILDQLLGKLFGEKKEPPEAKDPMKKAA